MTQQKLVKFLAKHPDKYFNTKQLAKALGTNRATITHTLAQMRRYGEVLWKMSKENQLEYLYTAK